MASAVSCAVEARGIFKSFGRNEVLHGVDFSIPVGDSRALVGRNGAGKSTLVGIITGLYPQNAGEVFLAGQPAPSPNDRRGWRERVACVYQRWMVIPQLTVGENLFLNNQPLTGSGLVDWRKLRQQSTDVLKEWDLDVSPDLEAWRLTVEQRQIVEIARALLQGSRFIILDEPTAELERREVNRLFDRIRALQQSGVTFLYISHHLEEIYEICKSVTVMRDGLIVAEAPLSELPKDKLIAAMVGEAVAGVETKASARVADADLPSGLTIRGLKLEGVVDGIDLDVRAGECVGLAGLAGSGKDDVAEAVAGLVKPLSGLIEICGKLAPVGDVFGMRRMGVGFVARDRHVRGLFPVMSVSDNLTITVLERMGSLGFISAETQSRKVGKQIKDLGIVTSSGAQAISELSGGNQQKTMVGRAFASNPKVLVVCAPTQGVDIASKQALYNIIGEARENGMAVLVVSDDLDELTICDRVEVVFRGKITRSFNKGWGEHEVVAAIEGLY